MRMLMAAAAAACLLLPNAAGASTRSDAAPAPAWGWQDQSSLRPTVYRHRRGRAAARRPAPPTGIGHLAAELAAVRKELDEVRAKIDRGAPSPWGAMPPIPWPTAQATLQGRQELASLPDLRLAPLPPDREPVPAAFLRATEAVLEARAYLLRTATPGSTMGRQGPDLAIGRLHPAFAVKLAQAVLLARQQGLQNAGIYSAYRPPAFGVGGFKDKFRSLHSYGLAVDAAGIGSPGSAAARLWATIVRTVGLFLPYGPNNRAEWNHTQMVAAKVAPAQLRATITASAPKDLRKMWLASGVHEDVLPTFVAAARSAHAEAAIAMLEHHRASDR